MAVLLCLLVMATRLSNFVDAGVCDGLDDSSVFDPHFYLNTYELPTTKYYAKRLPEMTPEEIVTEHWCVYGVHEGRQGSSNFYSKEYAANYPDLVEKDYTELVEHYLRSGLEEGRVGYGTARNCLPGWTQRRNHCYRHYSEKKTWTDARTFCISTAPYSGDLASIPTVHSSNINKFLAELSTDYSWIGGSDAASEGKWEWSDGTPWGYENWDANQPDNNGGKEHYLGLNYKNNGKWNDDKGKDKTKPFFCQYLLYF